MLRSLLFCLLTVVALCCPFHANAETDSVNSDRYALYYYHDRIDLQEDYLDNAMQMARIKDMLLHSPHIDSIAIYAYSSPEGSLKWNNWLAVKRAEAAKSFILSNLSNDSILQPENIILHPMGENWEGLYEELYANYHLLNRDAVLRIMKARVSTETKKWRLQNLDGGYTYTWIIRNHMPRLRVATWICVYVQKPDFVAPVIEDYKPDLGTIRIDTLPLPELLPLPVAEKRKSTMFALKTNLLYDAVTALNAEVEVPIGKRFSVMVEDVFPWWKAGPNGNKYCLQMWTMSVEPRWWFYRKGMNDRLQGHFVAPYVMSGKYDLQWDTSICYRGYGWSAGLTYGYSMPLCKWLNMEFSMSIGYLNASYQHYQPSPDYEHLYKDPDNAGRMTYVGPTKVKVSLVVPIRFSWRTRK
ncbi:MAG: DUF3575 domain-containing protein [Bacteroidaceae bacterium]|nr:DUF3575 domain-containing protein [Bacteroidaceae bacterium]